MVFGVDANFIAKSLFISGDIQYIDINDVDCEYTMEPTAQPTYHQLIDTTTTSPVREGRIGYHFDHHNNQHLPIPFQINNVNDIQYWIYKVGSAIGGCTCGCLGYIDCNSYQTTEVEETIVMIKAFLHHNQTYKQPGADINDNHKIRF